MCRRCGAPTRGLEMCPSCWQTRRQTSGIRAPYYFEGTLRTMIHRLKYRHSRHLAEPLGSLLVRYLETKPVGAFDALVPVPLHPTRLRQRGYNQSLLLARVISDQITVPVIDDCLERVRDTPTQMSLPAQRRLINVHDAFRARGTQLAGARVLLIDDVCTTGATLEACAAALRRGGAKDIWGLALARARPSTNSTHP